MESDDSYAIKKRDFIPGIGVFGYALRNVREERDLRQGVKFQLTGFLLTAYNLAILAGTAATVKAADYVYQNGLEQTLENLIN